MVLNTVTRRIACTNRCFLLHISVEHFLEDFLYNITVASDLACIANLHRRRTWHRKLDATALLHCVVRHTLGSAVCLVIMVEESQVSFVAEETFAP